MRTARGAALLPLLCLLRRASVAGDGGLDQRFERARVHRLAFADVDRPPRAARETRVEEARRIRKARAAGERELHDLRVGLACADDAVVPS